MAGHHQLPFLLLRQNISQQKSKGGFVAVHSLREYLVLLVPKLVASAVKNPHAAYDTVQLERCCS